MIYILLLLLTLLVIVSYLSCECDYMNPAVIYSFAFWIFVLMCVIEKNEYNITIHSETVLVIVGGNVIFLAWNLLLSRKKKKYCCTYELQEIKINKYLVGLIIVMQLITIVFFIKYISNISIAFYGGKKSISEMIGLYDTMTKFWPEIYSSLNVPIPLLYRIFSPISLAASYLIIYVVMNNYFAIKKIKFSHILVILLLAILILLNGSRSPLFRIVTMMGFLYYYFRYKTGNIKKGSLSLLLKIMVILVMLIVFFVILLEFMGRLGSQEHSISEYLFTYMGAPIVNLDTFILKRMNYVNTDLFGMQTFRPLYNFLGKMLHNKDWIYTSANVFSYSANGIEIGNVYTSYYNYLYDFGIAGVFPLVSIVAIYYNFTYRNILTKRKLNHKIDFEVFVYAYLINDLVMQPFSSRFYETVLDISFIKLIILAVLFNSLLIEQSIEFLGRRIVFPEVKKIKRRG